MNRSVMRGLLAATALAAAGAAQAQARYYDDGYYPRGIDRTVRCESREGRTAWCRLDTRGGVRLVQQFSDSACIRGRSWGVRGDAVWVTRGCRARFAASPYRDDRYYGYDERRGRDYDRGRNYDYDDRYDRGYYDNRGYYDGRYGNDRGRVIRCQSHDGRYNFCRTSGYASRVQIRRVMSDANCRLNSSWGTRNGGIWVDRGCRAEFVLY